MLGKTLSHYKIVSELGRGGMGIVFKAEDILLERTVALKVLPAHILGDRVAKERFFREAKSAGALNHPNICTIYEFGETDDGQSFIAMEFVPGSNLKDRIAEGRLPLSMVLSIAVQIVDGLIEAHESGIVHRDIKSANLMLSPKDQVKIMDFGLANLSGHDKLTKSGSTVGTMGYMSPEQVTGDPVDARSDLFSVGVVIYELLTGKMPFEGEYEASVLYSLLNNSPRPLQEFDSTLSAELQMFIDRALAKQQEDRYQDANEMLDALHRIQGNRTEIRTPASRTSRWRTSRRSILTIVASLVIVVAAFTVLQFLLKQDVGDVPDSQPRFLIASEYYFAGRFDQAIEVLAPIAEDNRNDPNYRRAAFGMLAGVYVDVGRFDDAKVAISRLLDFEPPLITILPNLRYVRVQELYEEVRRERVGTVTDTSSVNALAIYPFRPLYETDTLYQALASGLSSLLIGRIAKAGITVVERESLDLIVAEERLQSSDSVFTDVESRSDNKRLMQMAVPWVILDENQLPGELIPASHIMLGSFVVRHKEPEKSQSEFLVSAWVYNSTTGQLRAADQVRGTSSELFTIVEELADRLVERVGR